ncbi:MAG: LapA family protein [Candidatus Paceibacterota bacterium]
MIILFIIGILLGAVSVIFAFQNVAVITVSFFSWELTGPLAYVLLLAITSGILIAVLMLLPESIGNHFRYRSLRKENEKLAEELKKQKELTVFAKNTPPTEEEIRKIEEGASYPN